MILFVTASYLLLQLTLHVSGNIDINTGYPNFNNEAATYINSVCNVSITVSYNANVNIVLILPQIRKTKNTCERSWFNGTRDQCTSSEKVTPLVSIDNSNVFNSDGGSLQSPNDFVLTFSNSTQMAWFVNSSNSLQKNVTISLSLTTTDSVEYIGEILSFIVQKNGDASSQSSKLLYIIGPHLTVKGTPSSVNLEAGSSFTMSLTIQHHSNSTESASDIIMNMQCDQHLTITSFTGFVQQGTSNNLVYTNPAVLAAPASYSISVSVTLKDSYAIGKALTFAVDLSYKSTVRTEIPHQYNTSLTVQSTMGLTGGQLTGMIPANLMETQTFTSGCSFGMPKGTIYGVNLNAIFTSTNLWPITARLLSTQLTVASAHLRLSNSQLASISLANMTVSITAGQTSRRRRRRRATTPGSVTVKPTAVDIINPSVGGLSGAVFTLQGTFGLVSSLGAALPGTFLTSTFLGTTGQNVALALSSVAIVRPEVYITKNFTSLGTSNTQGYPNFKVILTLSHTANSAATAQNLLLSDDVTGLTVDSLSVSPAASNSTKTDTTLTYRFNQLATGQSASINYNAAVKDYKDFPEKQKTIRNTIITYDKAAGSSYTNSSSACLYRHEGLVPLDTPTNAFVILFILLGLLLGILIIFAIIILCMILCTNGRNPFDASPESERQNIEAKILKDSEDRLFMGNSSGGINSIKDLSHLKPEDSIVKALVLPSRIQILRSLDTMDVVHALDTDQHLESDYQTLSMDALRLHTGSLLADGTLTIETYKACIATMEAAVQTLDETNAAEYSEKLKLTMEELQKKNKLHMQLLIKRHQDVQIASAKEIEEGEEAEEMMAIIERQHEAERNDFIQKLKLEQDEEAEKVRKDFASKKRVALLEIEHNTLNQVVTDANLNAIQKDWLLKEHHDIKKRLDGLQDDEAARQRMLLEEKMERRKALLKRKDIEEESTTETLNTLVHQQKATIKRYKRTGVLAPEQADEYLYQLNEDMRKAKEDLETRRAEKEAELLQRLTSIKFERLAAKRKEQETELQRKRVDFAGQMTEMENGELALNPREHIEKSVKFRSRQRAALIALELEADEHDCDEYVKVLSDLALQTEDELLVTKDSIFTQLSNDGTPQSELDKIKIKHSTEIQKLRAELDDEREHQKLKLEAKLKERRACMDRDRELEKSDQADLRIREDNIVRSLLDGQTTISEDERDAIMREHERNMITLETSLTLSKLRQKRLLEEAYSKRKNLELEKLEKTHKSEKKKLQRKQESADSDEDDYDDLDRDARQLKERQDLSNRQAAERLKVIKGDLDSGSPEEEDQVRLQMLKEKADALKEQENQLGEMLGLLQMQKAKELAKIEEQQRAIDRLKMGLVDDLNSRGTLSDPQASGIITQHDENQKRLIRKLETDREKREKEIRQRMAKKMQEKEEQMELKNSRSLQKDLEELDPKDRGRVQMRMVVIQQRQNMETEKTRKHLQRELDQTLAEAHRQLELTKQQYLQDQELEFIAGLVRLGKFPRSQLLQVLKSFFPLRTEDQLMDMLNKILPPSENGKEEEAPVEESQELVQKSKLLTSLFVSKAATKFKSLPSPKRRPSTTYPPEGEDNDHYLPPIERPDPIGGHDDSPYDDMPYDKAPQRANHLQPLPGKKKKKKRRVKPSVVEPAPNYDDDDDYDN